MALGVLNFWAPATGIAGNFCKLIDTGAGMTSFCHKTPRPESPMTLPLHTRLRAAADTGSRSEREIARFILGALKSLPFETAASLASRVGVSEASVGRFCRAIGYANFKDLKDHLKDDIGDQPWLVKDRLDHLRAGSGARDASLTQGLEASMAALVGVYEMARGADWSRAVAHFATAPQIFTAGFQTERGLAQYFAAQMQYIRPEVHHLDLSAGNFAEALLAPAGAVVAIFEARRYSRQALVLAREARARGHFVALFTDQFCAWGADHSDALFAVETEAHQFWDSTAMLAVLGNMLINDIFLAVGESAETRMNQTAQLYGAFTGHVGNPLTPVQD